MRQQPSPERDQHRVVSVALATDKIENRQISVTPSIRNERADIAATANKNRAVK